MKKILTIGGAMRDIFIHYKNCQMMHLHTDTKDQSFIVLEEGKKIDIAAISYSTGGGALNSAVSFARQGLSVATVCKIGKDQAGNAILDVLKKEKINSNHVIQSNNLMTGNSFMIPCPSGNRAILVYRGANTTLTAQEIPSSAIADTDLVYITSLSSKTKQLLPGLVTLAKKNKKLVATNPGTSQLIAGADILRDSLDKIDILIVNAYEASLLMNSLTQSTFTTLKKQKEKKNTRLPELLRAPMGSTTACFTLEQYFQEILKRGPTIAVVTNGAEGVYATDGNKIYFHPSLKVNVVNTVGAGDAFGSTFVGQLAQGKSLEDAVRAGIINSSSVLQYLDTQTGLLKAEELEKQLQKLDKKLLKIFDV